MWGGRFDSETDPGFLQFTASVEFDARLFFQDVTCTRAWAGALASAGILTAGEHDDIEEALDTITDEFNCGSFIFEPTDEDIHTAVERRLVELAGIAGGKVRTGRSRNDQVATDMRLFVMDACDDVLERLRGLQSALVSRSREWMDVMVPGHTHLQQAQPVLLSHVLLAFFEMLERDAGRVSRARLEADVMPLGSGALAGTPVPVDRDELAAQLGFSRASANSVDAVSDRDFVCEALFVFTMIMGHLSRLAEQLVLWCSQEFGLFELSDAWATGSSLMPQKKNPDGPELIRGKTGRVTGALVAMLTVMKGIPLAYNRDMQEDKEPLFDSLETTLGSLLVMAGTVATMKVNRERAARMVESGFITATDLADALVERGVDFPGAHRIAGEIVLSCLRVGKDLADLTDEDLGAASEHFTPGSAACITAEASVSRRSALGGTSPEEVEKRLAEAEQRLSERQ